MYVCIYIYTPFFCSFKLCRSNNAAGQPTYSRYIIPLGSEEKAAEFVAIARKCVADAS